MNRLPAGRTTEPRSNFLLNVFQRKQDFFRDRGSFSKILIDFLLYFQFWHLTWIHPDLLMDGRDTRGQKSVRKTKPTPSAARHRC